MTCAMRSTLVAPNGTSSAELLLRFTLLNRRLSFCRARAVNSRSDVTGPGEESEPTTSSLRSGAHHWHCFRHARAISSAPSHRYILDALRSRACDRRFFFTFAGTRAVRCMVIDSFLAHAGPLFHIECVGGAYATVYLVRPLTAQHIHELGHLTRSIPDSVRFLRVQLRAAEADQYTMNALRGLVRSWRHRGNVHMVFLTDGEEKYTQERDQRTSDAALSSAAATAAFL